MACSAEVLQHIWFAGRVRCSHKMHRVTERSASASRLHWTQFSEIYLPKSWFWIPGCVTRFFVDSCWLWIICLVMLVKIRTSSIMQLLWSELAHVGNNSEHCYLCFFFLFQTLRIFFQGSCGEGELGTKEDGQRQTVVSHPSGDQAETQHCPYGWAVSSSSTQSWSFCYSWLFWLG